MYWKIALFRLFERGLNGDDHRWYLDGTSAEAREFGLPLDETMTRPDVFDDLTRVTLTSKNLQFLPVSKVKATWRRLQATE